MDEQLEFFLLACCYFHLFSKLLVKILRILFLREQDLNWGKWIQSVFSLENID